MKKLLFISGLLVVFAGYLSCRQKGASPVQDAGPPSGPEKAIAALLVSEVDSFRAVCDTMHVAVAADTSEGYLQQLFLRARLAYKRVEWATEYFDPATSRFVNGPPVEEVEAASHAVFEPAGLQVMEGDLFPYYDIARRPVLLRLISLLDVACGKYKTHFANIDMFDWQVFDAAKLEVFRIEALGISGFDNPATLNSMKESAAALISLRRVLGCYGDLQGPIDSAVSYLTANTEFNSFDRAKFIRRYCNPLTRGISDLESGLNIHVIRYNRLLNQDAKTLFDTNAFNVDAYSPDPASFMTESKVALGRVLFFDPQLSGNGTRSCGSCHQPEKAFTDGLVKNTVIGDRRVLRRNTPTLINAALQPSQFYDLRVTTLEDQSRTVVQNIEEMHGAMNLSAKHLWNDMHYRELFAKAFPRANRTGIDTLEVMNAISCYVRSLTQLTSRFDEYMRGNDSALDGDEIAGFNLYMGKAKCATCHYMPLFNGTFPPRFIKTESEVIGVPSAAGSKRIDEDRGRYDVIPVEAFRHAFKTPTLRNVARTWPYMHNGIYNSLDQVVDFYEKGGGVGQGIRVDNQTLPSDKLELTPREKEELIAFLRSLDSEGDPQ